MKRIPPSRKGIKLSDETRKKMSLARMGRKVTLKTRRLISTALKGSKSPLWKGGKKDKMLMLRRSLEYKIWRESVFKRDSWTCIWCGRIGGKICADHIKPFALYPELRFAIDNGRTLCRECHLTTETYGGRTKSS
jgi:hypothetical protein